MCFEKERSSRISGLVRLVQTIILVFNAWLLYGRFLPVEKACATFGRFVYSEPPPPPLALVPIPRIVVKTSQHQDAFASYYVLLYYSNTKILHSVPE